MATRIQVTPDDAAARRQLQELPNATTAFVAAHIRRRLPTILRRNWPDGARWPERSREADRSRDRWGTDPRPVRDGGLGGGVGVRRTRGAIAIHNPATRSRGKGSPFPYPAVVERAATITPFGREELRRPNPNRGRLRRAINRRLPELLRGL